MQTLYDLFETDPKMEKEGIGLQFGQAVFYVKRAGGANTDFDKAFEVKTRNMSSRFQLAALSEEQSSRMLQEVYFDSVMVGWKGVTDREGNALEYNAENFYKVMTDLPTVWKTIRQEAANHENFRRAQAKQEGDRLGN